MLKVDSLHEKLSKCHRKSNKDGFSQKGIQPELSVKILVMGKFYHYSKDCKFHFDLQTYL